jgi:nitrate reductase alpha subunit
MNQDSNNTFDNYTEQKLLFDLRQSWAVCMDKYSKTIMYYKLVKRDYQKWYETMILMTPLIFSRIRKHKRETLEEFKNLKEETKQTIIKYKATYLGQNKNEEGTENLTEALLNLELFLGRVTEKNNMYGTAIRESVI